MPSPKSIISAFCFCLLLTFCAVSAKADTTYTYTGKPFTAGICFTRVVVCLGASVDGSLTLASPLGDNLHGVVVEPESFSFEADGLIVNNLNVSTPSTFAFSTNASGQIDGWNINVTGNADFNGFPVAVTIGSFSNLAFINGEDAEDHIFSASPDLGGPGEIENLNMPGTWAVSSGHAQVTPTWTRPVSFGGSGSDSGSAVKADSRGNRYVTGAFSLAAKFGDNELVSAGGTDVFLAKFGRSGELRWLLQAGGTGDDIGYDIAFDRERNIYMSGAFTDSATFSSIHGPSKTVTGMGETIFLAKYRPSGELLWVQTGAAEFISDNEGFGVAVEPVHGTVFITGRAQGNTTFSSSDGNAHTVSGVGAWHMFLVKYDRDGNFQWGQSNAAAANSIPHKVAVDAHGNPYVTGWLEGTTTFHSNDGHDLTVTGLSQPIQSFPDFPDDAFIVKYDAQGNAKWANVIGGYKGIGTDIAVSGEGKISITGFIGNISGAPSQAETIATSQPGCTNINLGGGQLTNPYNKDAFVASYNSAGVLLEARRIGGMLDDGGSGIAYDHLGNLYVTGVFQGTIDVEGQTLTGKNPFNLFVLKFHERGGQEQKKLPASADGALVWAKKADGPGQNQFELNPRMGLTATGKVLVTGVYSGTAVFDAITLHSAGNADIFLAQLNAVHGHNKDDCESSDCDEQGDN